MLLALLKPPELPELLDGERAMRMLDPSRSSSSMMWMCDWNCREDGKSPLGADRSRQDSGRCSLGSSIRGSRVHGLDKGLGGCAYALLAPAKKRPKAKIIKKHTLTTIGGLNSSSVARIAPSCRLLLAPSARPSSLCLLRETGEAPCRLFPEASGWSFCCEDGRCDVGGREGA